MSLTLIYAVSALVILFLGMLLIYFSLHLSRSDSVNQRLQEYTINTDALNTRPILVSQARNRELSGSFGSRLILPSFRRISRLFGKLTPASEIEDLTKKMAIAGNPLGLGPREFYGLRLIFIILGFWLSFLIISKDPTTQSILFGSISFLVCAYLPKTWLKGRVRGRQNKIRKGLPDALDMLSVCADAGLGFDQSLQRVSEYWKTPLGAEFSKIVSEMTMGVSRQDALRNFSTRLEISEISSFVAVILQSDQLGMSIAETLSAQAQQMRIERRFRAQEQARKAPLKMLAPLILFIFPAMFAVILGPVIPAFMDVMGQVMNNMTNTP